MNPTIKKLMVMTSGGDAPGMNAAIRAVVRTAVQQGIEIYGVEAGYCGLVAEKLLRLTPESIANCIQRGGTIIKTGRCPEFREPATRSRCIEFIQSQQMDGLIVLGGNGSFQGAQLLAQEGGLRVIGVPCTIDNDIPGTDYCIGFDSASNTAVQAIDKIRDTAFSLDRNFLIEVMGRDTGHLAVEIGIAGGAEMIVIPEIPITIDQMIAKLTQRKRLKMASIMVVAEAGKTGHTIELAKEIYAKSGINYTVCILGHTQRGGAPTVIDRKIAALMGYRSVMALIEGDNCKMVGLKDNQIILAPFPDPQQSTRFFNDKALLQLNNVICDIS